MKNDEMITLAKFLAISGIILPMLPHKNLIPDINLTPYSIWLATVVVSGISYLSYLLKRYVFMNREYWFPALSVDYIVVLPQFRYWPVKAERLPSRRRTNM